MYNTEHLHSVKEYYGNTLQSSRDLKTSACCSVEAIPAYQRTLLARISDEVIERFYGCGSPIPPELSGRTVVDLGCGTGRDSFLASQLVGASGQVIGVDMTPQQLDVAKRHLETHMQRFGYQEPNIRFHLGHIEDLRAAGIEDQSVDVVISNCVINLAQNKAAVFKEIFRILKPGGELYFSDVFSSRRLPETARNDSVLVGECLGGAIYKEDFRRILRGVGCLDFRVMTTSPIELDGSIRERVGSVTFTSMTIRAFKLENLEDICEDYGQVATYLGTIPECKNAFTLDDHHRFETIRPQLVCGNTASMLAQTRYGKHFRLQGNRDQHFGPFDCSQNPEDQLAPCC